MKKNLVMTALSLSLFILVIPANSKAQSLSSEDIKAQMVKEWERSKAYTIDYLNTMPANKYSFKVVDSIRSFAQQMLHLAQANVFFMSLATDSKPPSFGSDREKSTSAQTKDSVMYYVTTSYDYSINAVKSSDISKWGEKKKLPFGGYEETRFALLLKAIEHQAHHRGQTAIYIRLQGIKPPQERLF
ncbi:MAG TPA: DinB family protein [Chitinophagaceae bacterium]|nr:DinB family protein [Chitinophagaceae bacterium]